jgi:hypothetical protein
VRVPAARLRPDGGRAMVGGLDVVRDARRVRRMKLLEPGHQVSSAIPGLPIGRDPVLGSGQAQLVQAGHHRVSERGPRDIGQRPAAP